MPDLRTEVVTDFARLEGLADDWMRLWEADPRRNVFTTFEWARACWRAYGSNRSLCAPVVYEGDTPVGILPLVVDGSTLMFLGAPRSDYNDVLCAPTDAVRVIDMVLRAVLLEGHRWRRCVLDNLPADSKVVSKFGEIARDLRSRLHLTFRSRCPRVVFDRDSNSVLDSILKKKSLRRHENKMRRLGDVAFRHVEDRDEILSHLAAFFRQHVARRAMVGERSVFLEKSACEFIEALVAEFDPRTWLRFGVVEIGNEPVAFHFGFEVNGVFVWYKPTFQVNLWDYSPGEVLIKKLFEYAASRGLEAFDFTVGNEAFKMRFANDVKDNHTLHVYPAGFRGLSARLAQRGKDHLKRYPGVFSRLKSAFGALGSFARASSSRVRDNGALGLLGRAAGSLRRSAIFSSDEALIFAASADASHGGRSDLAVQSGKLEDLAYLVASCPGRLTVDRLDAARRRLKDGEHLYLVRRGGECVYLAWASILSVITDIAHVGSGCRIDLGRPAAFLHGGWSPLPGRAPELDPDVLRALVDAVTKDGLECWTSCRSKDRASRDSIAQAEFRLMYRMQRVRFLGWTARSRVLPASTRAVC